MTAENQRESMIMEAGSRRGLMFNRFGVGDVIVKQIEPRYIRYRRTIAHEEGRLISSAEAEEEYNSGIFRGIYEYLGEPRPTNGLHANLQKVDG